MRRHAWFTVGRRLDRRGATLALVALTLFVMLGLAALAIDLGRAAAAGAEAQRAADAAALAGASAYAEPGAGGPATDSAAQARALDYATRHEIRNTPITPGEVTVELIPAERKVRVRIVRPALSTWFANSFGISSVQVSKLAAAVAQPAPSTSCIKPFAVPDLWDENDPPSGNGVNAVTGDTDGDNIWDMDETWRYSPPPDGADYYRRWDPDAEASETQTGYGSTFRGPERDYGLEMHIKAQAPGGRLGPGFFYLLRLQDSQGGNDIRENILGCAPGTFSLDSTYRIEGGDKVGPTEQGIEDLIALDPDAHWENGTVVGSRYTNWQNSERVIKVGIFDPIQIATIEGGCSGNCELQFQNVALLFLEGFVGHGQNEYLQARFLGYAPGSGNPGGEASGNFPLVLRLVE